jgi:hypothetical protein
MTEIAEIRVTPWGTPKGTEQDPTAQWHDCLWEVAAEQATLERMAKQGENWQTAAGKITAGDISRHLDKICDENGFRHIDGSGSGRDPNLIGDGQQIKVERNPLDFTGTPEGLGLGKDPLTTQQYAAATGGDLATEDPAKKAELDKFLKTLPLAQLSDATKAEVIAAYARGVDKTKLGALVNTEAFTKLPPPQQQLLIANYGKPGHEAMTKAIDAGVAANPKADPDGKLGKVLKSVLEPYAGTAIPEGTTLQSGQSINLGTGKSLTMKEDGALVLQVDGKDAWHTKTGFMDLSRHGPAGDHVAWQADGNLVVYDSFGKKAWASDTAGHPGARLVLKDDGKLVIYDKDNKQIWASR